MNVGPTPPPSVYVQPGDVVVGTQLQIVTVLGSCVAVCLLDVDRQVGGMNHYLLPRGRRDSSSARFADVALPQLLERVLAAGAVRSALAAKVFGGARVLAGPAGRFDLGAENVAAALHFLEAERIPVVARATGGERGRKLILRTSDGVVWLKTF